jgi:hypothetical protein
MRRPLVIIPVNSECTGPIAHTQGPLITLDARDLDARDALNWLADRLDSGGWTNLGVYLRDVTHAHADP